MLFDEAFALDGGIDLGGGDVGMTEHFLNGAEVCAASEEMGGKAMAKEVRLHFVAQAAEGGVALNPIPNGLSTEGRAALGEEEAAARFRFHKGRARACEVDLEGIFCLTAKGNQPLFSAFA